jgi:hypothetical protein
MIATFRTYGVEMCLIDTGRLKGYASWCEQRVARENS